MRECRVSCEERDFEDSDVPRDKEENRLRFVARLYLKPFGASGGSTERV